MIKLFTHTIYTFLLFTISAGQFGQNIVQYDDFEWFYIQSYHFDIYYYDVGSSHAEYVAHEAEKAYKNISKHLDWDLKDRYSIIVYNSHNDFQQTNVVDSYMYEGIGGVTELYKTRVVIPFDGSHREFKHVIHHELVHMFINDYIYGGSLQNVISNQINYVIPLWMNEGLAEYLADNWNTTSDMWIRDLTLNHGELPTFNQLNGYLAYRGGQSVWKFITGKWGDESIAEIFYQIKKKKNVANGVRNALGIELSEINDQWHEYLKKTYFPEISNKEKLTDFSRRLTNHKKLENNYNIAPAISPDGSKVAIYSNKSGNMGLYLLSIETGEFINKIIQGERNSEFEELHILKPGISWSPKGSKLVFSAKSGKSDALFIYNIETEKTKKIRLGLEGIFRPTWSPIGDEIAFIGNNGEKSDIYIYNLISKSLLNLTNDWFTDDHVSWSPNGLDLLFISDRDEYMDSIEPKSIISHSITQMDIYSISRSNGNISRITNTDWDESYPVMTSQNNLAFVSDKTGINNIYILNENLSEPQPITNVLTGISQLNWNSDYSQLVFTGFEESGYDIFLFVNPLAKLEKNYDLNTLDWVNEIKSTEFQVIKNRDQNTNNNEFRNFVFTHKRKSNPQNKSKSFELADSSRLDENGNFIQKKYLTRFSLDLAQGYASYNTLYSPKAMASFLWSDVLGDHKVNLGTQMQITSFKNSDYYLYYRLLPFKIDYNFLFYHTAVKFIDQKLLWDSYGELNDCVPNNINPCYYESYLRQLMLNTTASIPTSRFHRFDLSLNYSHVEKVSMYQTGITDYGIIIEEKSENNNDKYGESISTFIPSLSMVWDNTIWEYIFPNKGSRFNINMKVSPKIGKKGITFQSIILDYRKYYPIKNGISLGGRIYSGYSFGKNAQLFKMGGIPWIWSSEEEYYLNEINDSLKSVYFSEYVMPLRGALINEKSGHGTVLFNMEIRLPLLIYYFPAIKYLGQISAVIFSDLGFTWNENLPNWTEKYWNKSNNEGFIWTFGFGPRFIFLGLPWQLDYAWKYNPYPSLSNEKIDRSWFLTIGLDF